MSGSAEIEMRIKQIWSKFLHVDVIEPYQSFFELGGDSLMMIDMLAQIGDQLGIEVNPGLLFQDATLRGFAELVFEAQLNSSSRVGTV